MPLAKPIDEAFDYFADFRNENEWNVVAHDIRLLNDGPIGVGSRFQGEYDRMGTMDPQPKGAMRLLKPLMGVIVKG